ncbi:MAG: DNA-binding protein [Oscillospiraceae bacterium]|nr:DNA-binding protein [Oscillospiraceae bacterium]
MDYTTLKEASERWGISARMINYYCAMGRIPGAVKMASVWLVPKDARKPTDRRKMRSIGKDAGGNDESE